MKIKLVGYPYRGFDIGTVCDFGEEKNKSLVALGRAVWMDGGQSFQKQVQQAQQEEAVVPAEEETKEAGETKEDAEEAVAAIPEEEKGEKKFLQNDLQQKVQKKKQQIGTTPLRGPGGKFLSKKAPVENAQQESEEQPKKKGFWNKII